MTAIKDAPIAFTSRQVTRQTQRTLDAKKRAKWVAKTGQLGPPVKIVRNPNAPRNVQHFQTVSVGGGRRLTNAKQRKLELAEGSQVRGERKYKGGTRLDKFNELQDHRVLHPTKGYRKVNTDSAIASSVTAVIKRGIIHPIDLRTIRREMFMAGHQGVAASIEREDDKREREADEQTT